MTLLVSKHRGVNAPATKNGPPARSTNQSFCCLP